MRYSERLGTNLLRYVDNVVRRSMPPPTSHGIITGSGELTIHHEEISAFEMLKKSLRDSILIFVVCNEHENLAGWTFLEPIGDRLFRMIAPMHAHHHTFGDIKLLRSLKG